MSFNGNADYGSPFFISAIGPNLFNSFRQGSWMNGKISLEVGICFIKVAVLIPYRSGQVGNNSCAEIKCRSTY